MSTSTLIAEAAIKRHHALKALRDVESTHATLRLNDAPAARTHLQVVGARAVLTDANEVLERHIEDLLAKARRAAS